MKMSKTNNFALKEVGEIVHKARSGRLIVKLDEKNLVNAGDLLFNSICVKVGSINELIGPVRSPYASIIMSNDKFQVVNGDKIYKSDLRNLEGGGKSRKFKKRNMRGRK
jgi:rRNA processing protein Gar1